MLSLPHQPICTLLNPPALIQGNLPTNLALGTCQSGIKDISIQVGAAFLTVTRSTFPTFTRLNALTALVESILAIIAIAALVAGLLINSITVREPPVDHSSIEYEAD